ncbi:MAG: alpha/beta hydrolase [Kiritimatiellae bacterium]|jgi:hypothetical protein|nr:alpha/beta hydrolase [Kiritimatiellia bacterium]
MHNVKTIEDISYADHEECRLDLYIPTDKPSFKTVIFVHGGGIESCEKQDLKEIAVRLASKGIAFVAPGYRKFPKVQYPTFIDDIAQAVKWVKDNINKYGECKEIFLGGQSAGAYLSMMLCFDTQYLNKVEMTPDDLAGYIFASGQPTTHFNILKYRGTNPQKVVIDEAAPLYHIENVVTNSPILIFVTDNDIPNRLEQNVLLESTLKCVGYDSENIELQIIENHDHGSYLNKKDNQSEIPIVDIIVNWLNSNKN